MTQKWLPLSLKYFNPREGVGEEATGPRPLAESWGKGQVGRVELQPASSPPGKASV